MGTYVIVPRSAKRGWNKFFTVLQFCFIPVVIWWFRYDHLPPPGWAVALIAVAAAIMSIHEEMRGWQKFLWISLIGALLVAELRAIGKDRTEAAHQASVDRQNEHVEFERILTQDNNHFDTTAQGLKDAYTLSQRQFAVTVGEMSKSLAEEEKVFEQTRPKAYVAVTDIDYRTPLPLTMQADKPFFFNVAIKNQGSDVARNLWSFGKVYVGSRDRKEAEKAIVPDFEKSWAEYTARMKPGLVLNATEPQVFS